jgi:hypothetical protein
MSGLTARALLSEPMGNLTFFKIPEGVLAAKFRLFSEICIKI